MPSIKCSVCSNEINHNYCSNCGQHLRNNKLTILSILSDLFGSIFSLERSFVKNLKIAFTQPQLLITNYWSGFRGYYYSPGKFFTIAALFLLIHYTQRNDFLGIRVDSDFATQFFFLLINITILTLVNMLTYIRQKKNFFEHLLLLIYNVSLWTIIFVPVSIGLNLFVNKEIKIEGIFLFAYFILIMIWNSRAFDFSKSKRFLMVLLNFVVFIALLYSLSFLFSDFTIG